MIKSLADNPRPVGIESLTNYKGLFRIRSGNYRIVYMIDDEGMIVIVVVIGDRKLVYDLVERRYG